MIRQRMSLLYELAGLIGSSEPRTWLKLLTRPLVGCALVGCLVVLVGYLDTRLAHAETDTLACPVGLEQSGALCYPVCQDGFYGDGPICVQHCPAGFIDDIALCRKDAVVFAKASYGRGAGVGLTCAANQEAQGGLCYPRCIATHYGAGPVCWQRCPAGYVDDGAFCRRPFPLHIFAKNSYGRGAGGPVSTCAAGLERNGALCYPRCVAGFYGAGPVCFQRCPAGYRDDGALCRKDAVVVAKVTYPRGAGVVMNTVPEALDGTFQTPVNTAVDLIFEHDDFDDDRVLPTTIMQQPTNGLYDGERYIPNQNFEGEDRILWKTNDGKNDSNTAVLTLLVGNVGANTAPVALDRTVTVTEETPITLDVLCTDVDSDALLYQLLDAPQHGLYQWQPPNTVVYTPTVDFVGADAFTFRSHDGQEFSNVSTITFTVVAVNDAPVALAETISTTRNVNAGILLQASDVEGDPITYTVVSSPTHGALSGAVPDLVYTPQQNFVGVDSFSFQAADNHGAATVATIHITILPTNTIPVAEDLIVTTTQENAVAINLNATDGDEDDLTYTLVSSPTHGALAGAGIDWVYTPDAGFLGTDGLTFKANDGQADSAAATVTISVTAAPAEASLVGIVFDDSDDNGQLDGNESGVHGLLVTLTPTRAGGAAGLTATTEAGGGWRIDGAPFGQYTLRVSAANGTEIATAVTAPVDLSQRGVQQMEPIAVKVTGRSVFLPILQR